MLLFIDDDYCSVALILWADSSVVYYNRVCLVLVVVARWPWIWL